MLLYLYPIGAFSYTKFHKYYKTIGIYQKKALEEFIEDGYIYVWNTGKNNVKLYALTDKAKKLCDMMHKYCVGDEKFPLNDEDELVRDKKTRINNYYLDMMKDMNKRKKQR